MLVSFVEYKVKILFLYYERSLGGSNFRSFSLTAVRATRFLKLFYNISKKKTEFVIDVYLDKRHKLIVETLFHC
jgi:hypothetical protein